MTRRLLPCLPTLLFALCAPLHAADEPLDSTGQIKDDQYNKVLAGEWRSSEHRLRDPGRRPVETLRFFDLSPTQTVLEISPGDGWYSEILAPLLRGQGQYIVAFGGTDDAKQKTAAAELRSRFEKDPARYDAMRVIDFEGKAPKLGDPESVDLVISFDDLHDWQAAGTEAAMFSAAYKVLKPGGKLGVTAFRAAKDATLDQVKDTGYLPTDHVIGKAKDAGFVLATTEEMHANPQDTHDHPNGVWSLPPYLDGSSAEDKRQYEKIGEPDRMTLVFVKPSGPRP